MENIHGFCSAHGGLLSGVRFRCSLDGGPLTFCDSPKAYTLEDLMLATGTAAGPHTFEVIADKPNLLVEPEPAIWEWTIVDNAAPDTQITRQPADPSAEPFVFEFTGTDNGTLAENLTFECSLDGEPFSSCSSSAASPYELQNLTAGEHTLEVRALDLADPANVDPTPASYTWTAMTPPETTITSQPENPSTSANATFEFSDQAGSTYECVLDPVDGEPPNFQPCESGVTYENLLNGEHVFQVRATNALGIVEEAPVEYAWTVDVPDTTAPETTIDLKPPATTQNTTATFEFAGTDNQTAAAELTFECKLDEEPDFSGCSSPHDIQDLTVGEHTLLVRAVDGAGNLDESPASYTWTVEPPPPPNTLTGTDVTVTLDLPGGSGNATVTFPEVTADGTTALAALDGASPVPADYFQAGALYYDLSTIAQFTAPVTVCLAYNPGSFSEPARLLHHDGSAWTDITTTNNPDTGLVCGEAESLSPFAIAAANPDMAPKTTILTGPDNPTVSTEAQFTFESANAPSAEFECSLDTPPGQSSWGSCPNPVTYNGLTVGDHEILVRAKDDLGKVDLTPARYQWTIKPLPETTIDPASGPEDLLDTEQGVQTDSTEATFTFSSDQPGATFECRLDLGGYEPCTSPKEYTDLAFEEHDFFVRAVDADGNVDPTPAEFSWEIADITAPETTIDSGPDATTSDTSARFEFSSNETEATFECSLDGGNFAACSSPRTYNGLTVGEHTLRVQAKDPTENVDPTPATYIWTVEPPNTPAGTNVAVDLEAPNGTPATVLFERVTSPGETTLTAASEPPTLPTGYLQVGSRFYDVDTTATFTGTTEVCLGYDPATFTDPDVRILHFENGAWTDVTTRSPSSGLVCGTVQSLSPFAVAAPADTAPETQITTQPAKTSNSPTATFGFSGTDDKTSDQDLRFECRLDGAEFTTCSSPQDYSGLNEGSHTFDVRATDSAGNTSSAVGYTWTVDTTVPETMIGSKPDALTSSTSASFTFSGEPGSTFECKLDAGQFTACDSPEEYTGLANGEHSFEVRATDAAGNTAAPVSHTWTVDATAPEATLTDKPAAPPTAATATFTFSSGEPGAKLRVLP